MADDEVAFPQMTKEEVASLTVAYSDLTADAGSQQLLRDVLDKHGVAIVSGVADDAQCRHLEACWRQDLVSLVDRDAVAVGGIPARKALRQLSSESKATGPSSIQGWASECSGAIGLPNRGFGVSRGVPHGEFAWQCRLLPSVKRVFATAFEVDPSKLSVGLDNVMWSPPEAPASKTNVEWLHVDQNHNTGLTWPCFQGILYVWSSESSRASTTVVWPGSHREDIYDKVIMPDPFALKKGQKTSGQLVKLRCLESDAGRELHKKSVASARRVPVPRGSLLLWDSRTTHQGWKGGPRLAQPVCWEPTERRPHDALVRKLWMCATGSPSSHSSTEGRVHALAPKAPCSPFAGCVRPDGQYVLPLKSSLVPFGVKRGAEDKWMSMQKTLWSDRGDRWASHAGEKSNVDEMRSVLRDEVVDAL
jgi:hypothetical protein